MCYRSMPFTYLPIIPQRASYTALFQQCYAISENIILYLLATNHNSCYAISENIILYLLATNHNSIVCPWQCC